jgi:ubiquinone/menaquinone biosynthesis C-methylase UbiE
LHPRQTVKAGYNKIASQYATTRKHDSEDVQLLRKLVERLPKNATILDAGCGSGYPVTQLLAQHFQVTGLDFALKQIQLAKNRVLGVEFICADVTNLPIRGDTFDAVCCYYSIIHIPRSEHPKVLVDFLNILRPAGLALLCMGAGDLPEDSSRYHSAPMFWSHYDRETNLEMIADAGLHILWSKTIVDSTDPCSVHLFVLAEKRGKDEM